MRIVVNHLTRMDPGYVCVAGYDPTTLEHIRPVLGQRLTRSLLRSDGGPFDIGYDVDLGSVRDVGSPPELEDRAFDESSVTLIGRVPEERFWSELNRLASPDLRRAFGDDLERHGNGFAVSVGKGAASLACLAIDSRPAVEVNDYGRLRCRFEVEGGLTDLSVTDIRLYEDDQKTIREEVAKELQRKISAGVEIVLSVGLTRPWQKPGDTQDRHWLQVNNVFVADDPFLASAER